MRGCGAAEECGAEGAPWPRPQEPEQLPPPQQQLSAWQQLPQIPERLPVWLQQAPPAAPPQLQQRQLSQDWSQPQAHLQARFQVALIWDTLPGHHIATRITFFR